MKKILSIFIFTAFCNYSNAQGLTQSTEGKSAILINGSALGFDVTKTEISFQYNNLNKPVMLDGYKINHYGFWGIDAKTRNEEGLGGLFSAGQFIPSALLNFRGGYSWSNAKSKRINEIKSELNRKLIKVNIEIFNEFKSTVQEIINESTNQIADVNARQNLHKELSTFLSDNVKHNKREFIRFITGKTDPDSEIQETIDSIEAKSIRVSEELEQRVAYVKAKHASIEEVQKAFSFWKIILFGYGGLNGIQFTRVKEVDPNEFLKSFERNSFKGGQFGGGINATLNQWRFGLTYSYLKTTNFDLLSRSEYTYTNKSTSGTTTLSEEKKITAYAGDYGEIEINELNFDLIFATKLDSNAKNHVLINPYLRSKLFSRNKELQPNTLNVGIGFYFFKHTGSFLGGFYCELPDINNNIEKTKPADVRNIQSPLKRVDFGIVAKFNFRSLISW